MTTLRMRVVEAVAEEIRGTIGDDLIDDAYCRVVAERALDAILDCLAENGLMHECDGTTTCAATEHIHGCYQSKREDR